MSLAPATSSPLNDIREVAADIKLAHSVFALPFALLAAFMARSEASLFSQFAGQLTLIVLAMVFARTVAMLANRLLDRHIDKFNPRTANRAIPSGRLQASRAMLALVICAALFLLVCATFGILFANWWPLILGPIVLIWLSVYALFKRFTALCHVYLGSSLALSPLAAAIAINPLSILEQPALWLLSAMVLGWVAGFDIIYALQDVDVDRQQNLHSMPSRFGVPHSLFISRTLHVAAAACLLAAILVDSRLNALFAIGVAIVCGLLVYEHLTVWRWGTTKIALAFFTLNGVISCVLGVLGIADVLLG